MPDYDPVRTAILNSWSRLLRRRAIDRHSLETGGRVLVVNQQMAARFCRF